MAAAIIGLIAALVPLLVQFISWLQTNRNPGPVQRRRIGVVLGHIGRLREKCEQIESHGAAIGCVAEDGEIGAEDDE